MLSYASAFLGSSLRTAALRPIWGSCTCHGRVLFVILNSLPSAFHLSICFFSWEGAAMSLPPRRGHCRHVDILVYVVLGPSRRMDHPSFLQKTWPMVAVGHRVLLGLPGISSPQTRSQCLPFERCAREPPCLLVALLGLHRPLSGDRALDIA
ncbi:hypothetical protein B0H12DRAFT_168705 [Mycena haematopus]|nr:hypothetical protein B0H12DRAFT_168705 [Mycena haematopus]